MKEQRRNETAKDLLRFIGREDCPYMTIDEIKKDTQRIFSLQERAKIKGILGIARDIANEREK